MEVRGLRPREFLAACVSASQRLAAHQSGVAITILALARDILIARVRAAVCYLRDDPGLNPGVRIPLNRSQKLVDTVSVAFPNLELTHPVCIIDAENDV